MCFAPFSLYSQPQFSFSIRGTLSLQRSERHLGSSSNKSRPPARAATVNPEIIPFVGMLERMALARKQTFERMAQV